MRPIGWKGKIFSLLMERMNRRAYLKTMEAVAPKKGQSLLEIGFGTGAFLKGYANEAGTGTLAGVDPSPLMVRTAKRRLRRYRKTFVQKLEVGDDTTQSFAGERFDRIVAIHSFQFWTDPEHTLTRFKELLEGEGEIILTLRDHGRRPPKWLPNPISRSGDEVQLTLDLLRRLGFSDAAVISDLGESTVLLSGKQRD